MVVRAVYEHVRIKHHFDRRAWVSVPANFIKNEVLRDLLVQLSPSGLKLDFTNSAKEEEELLGEELTKLLSGPGHYLIIMDDVKARDNAWKALTRYLHGTGGNRILINTGEVDPSTTLWAKTFDLGPLPREVSLRAALCSNSTSPGSSNSSIETLFWCCPRLSLQLKACLLYMFLFPRGFEISVRRALCLWVSEGFLDCKKVVQNNHPPPEPEDLARICFNKLFRAKLIEVIKWKLDGSPKTCRVPLFVHDNFYETSKNLFTVCQHEDDHQHLVRFVKYQDNASASHTNDQQLQDDLRSYICLSLKARGKTTKEIGVLDSMILSRFALLKVLDLEGVYKPQLPDSMGKLTLLRLLGLRSTLIDSLPRSISELPNLETLDLKNTDTLTGLCIGEGRSSPSGLERMNKLEKLKLRYHPTSVGGAAALVSQNTLLRSLRLSSTDPSDPYDCREELNLSSHLNLQKLYLLTKLRLSEPETATLADQPAAAQNQPAVYPPEVESAAKPAEQLAFPGNQPDMQSDIELAGSRQHAVPGNQLEIAPEIGPAEQVQSGTPGRQPEVISVARPAQQLALPGNQPDVQTGIDLVRPTQHAIGLEVVGAVHPPEIVSTEPAEQLALPGNQPDVQSELELTGSPLHAIPGNQPETVPEIGPAEQVQSGFPGLQPEVEPVAQPAEQLGNQPDMQLGIDPTRQPQHAGELVVVLSSSIRQLTLSKSCLDEDSMGLLGRALPKLAVLRLFAESYTGSKMRCTGFPELRILKLWKLKNLEEVIVESGDMSNLHEMEIRECPMMKKFPRVKHLGMLKELTLTNVLEDLVKDVERNLDNQNTYCRKNNGNAAFLIKVSFSQLVVVLQWIGNHLF
ncbi:hypothetical protein CDL15_Pgr027269 [Punica granatum]|uniref:Uncharacterized protein n=1 Tax=Punica granatum TaxID=22663 RepID=A0A218XM65_PUNGR|nr:hypothetical protein CDL15_Pgr027269 [Punica granatum]